MPYGYTPPSPQGPWGPGIDPFGEPAPPWTPPEEAPPPPPARRPGLAEARIPPATGTKGWWPDIIAPWLGGLWANLQEEWRQEAGPGEPTAPRMRWEIGKGWVEVPPPAAAPAPVMPAVAPWGGPYWGEPYQQKPFGPFAQSQYEESLRAYKEELYKQSAAGQFQSLMAMEAPVTRPAGWEKLSLSEKIAWANQNALAGRFVDEAGNFITFEEAERLMREDPEVWVSEVYYFGGRESSLQHQFRAGELYSVGYGPTTKTYPGGGVGYMKGKYDPPELLGMKRAILTSNMSYDEKLRAMLELVPQAGSAEVYRRLRAEVLASLTPEQKKAYEAELESEEGFQEANAQWRAWKERTGGTLSYHEWLEAGRPTNGEPEAAKPVDIDALGKAIAPYGVNVVGNWPFLSPITEAHLRRMPTDILEQMARYLEEKGISWRDYLELGRVYAGTAPARAAWSAARQW